MGLKDKAKENNIYKKFVEENRDNLIGRIVKLKYVGEDEESSYRIKNVYLPEDSDYVLFTLDNNSDFHIITPEKLKEFIEDEFIIEEDLKISLIKYEEEKTAFNDAELFVKEYRDYLIGKTIKYQYLESQADSETKIEEITVGGDSFTVQLQTNPVGNINVELSDLQSLIDGEEVVNDNTHEVYELVLQEEKLFKDNEKFVKLSNYIRMSAIEADYFKNDKNEEVLAFLPLEEDVAVFLINGKDGIGLNYSWGGFKQNYISEAGDLKENIDKTLTNQINWDLKPNEIFSKINEVIKSSFQNDEKINKSDFRYYILNNNSKKIECGFEYKEDAVKCKKEKSSFNPSESFSVHTKKELEGFSINPDDNSNWFSNDDDIEILDQSLSADGNGFKFTSKDLIENKKLAETFLLQYIDRMNGQVNLLLRVQRKEDAIEKIGKIERALKQLRKSI